MTKKMAMRCYVSGKVQGVWFRASTKTQADALNITGWAKNLPDGRVEVVAHGDEVAIQKLYAWLKVGPELAIVSDITYEELPWENKQKFDTI